jgi:hypothetical protein
MARGNFHDLLMVVWVVETGKGGSRGAQVIVHSEYNAQRMTDIPSLDGPNTVPRPERPRGSMYPYRRILAILL